MNIVVKVLLLVVLLGVQNVYAGDGDIGTVSCTTTKSDGTEFVPSWGKVIIDEDQYTRYVIQYMYWHDYKRLWWLNTRGDATFEPDVFFYNYEGQAYGKKPTGYWSSDLPSPYVDAQTLDGSDEYAVTIGSASAVSLTQEKTYYTVTRMTAGGGDSSWVKLSAQRGRQVPAGCTSVWCSYGCEMPNNNYRTIPFQDHFSAPGCQRYNWLWNTTVRRGC